MLTIHERNTRAAAYIYRCQRKRYHKANAIVQRALLSSSFLFVIALAAYIITR